MSQEILSEVFLRVVKQSNGCWNYNIGLTRKGYGRIMIKGVSEYIHRFVYRHVKGNIPKDHLVCHKCDNRRCINPEHLFTGTDMDNTKDMISKGRQRHPVGEQSGRVTLTEIQVKEIKVLGQVTNLARICRILQISPGCVSHILNNNSWKHVPMPSIQEAAQIFTKFSHRFIGQ